MLNKSNRPGTLPALLATLLILAGCASAPRYERAEVATPAAFKEAVAAAPAASAGWKEAQPSEHIQRGAWWQVFGDEQLNGLEEQAMSANQNLKAATARLKQSRALREDARSSLFPQVDAALGASRARPSPVSQGLPDKSNVPTSTSYNARLGISYELDVFGRVSATVDAASADLQKGDALFFSVQLALQADVAQTYFLIRELDAEQAHYTGTVTLRSQTLKLVQRRYDEGDISELDLARARSELATAQSESFGIARARSNAEHALALLIGQTPAEFSLKPTPMTRMAINVPAGVPSALLERRPDISAAERAMAAANARIGVARSAFFPRFDLTGTLGHESASLGDLFSWSTRTFLIGPLLSMPVFDGGRRQAGVSKVEAVYQEEVANYRQTVLNAFREVEDSLAELRLLAEQVRSQDAALQASERAAALSHIQYREGSVSFLSVIDADRNVLQQRRVAAQLDGARAKATVSLIRSLGGGWQADGYQLAQKTSGL